MKPPVCTVYFLKTVPSATFVPWDRLISDCFLKECALFNETPYMYIAVCGVCY